MLRGLFSALFILLFAGGGAGLPFFDGVLFHGRSQNEVPRSHFETTSGCHADGCTVLSTAQQERHAPVLDPVARVVSAPFVALLLPGLSTPLAEPLRGQPLSRAPPLFG